MDSKVAREANQKRLRLAQAAVRERLKSECDPIGLRLRIEKWGVVREEKRKPSLPLSFYLDFRPLARIYSVRGQRLRTAESAEQALSEVRRIATVFGDMRLAIQWATGRFDAIRMVPIGAQSDWQEEYRQRMWLGAKRRAAKEGIDFDIEVTDLVVPEFCPVFGVPLEPTERGTGHGDHAPSIDRIDPTRGYVKGNVAVISWRANRIKGRFTADELRRVAEWLEYVETVPPLLIPAKR